MAPYQEQEHDSLAGHQGMDRAITGGIREESEAVHGGGNGM